MASERLSRQDRREAILDAAGRVFGATGFDATRMDDVAQAAGVAKGLVYKHFASKDALFEALIDRQGRLYVAELRRLLGAADVAGSPSEATRRGLALWMQQFASDPADVPVERSRVAPRLRPFARTHAHRDRGGDSQRRTGNRSGRRVAFRGCRAGCGRGGRGRVAEPARRHQRAAGKRGSGSVLLGWARVAARVRAARAEPAEG